MLLLVDNYDSFTYNLVQALETLGAEVVVVRNDCKIQEACLPLRPRLLLIGPGPGDPSCAGVSNALIRYYAGIIPILGVCLGHQCLAHIYGGHIVRAKKGPVHGKTSAIFHTATGVFSQLPQGFLATRYHSLVVERNSLPDCFEVTAETADGEVMGIRHREFTMEGVQFHPESVLTTVGNQLLENFLHFSTEHVTNPNKRTRTKLVNKTPETAR